MRKLLLLITIGILSLNILNAQTSEHLTFRGVPIDGDISEFVKKMEGKGFVYNSTDDGIATMKGKFANYDCEMYIVASPKTDQVWRVVLFTSKNENWTSIKADYKKMKATYTKKYGTPSSEYEFFSEPYYEGDGYELQALSKDKCNYISFWSPQNGSIKVEISSNSSLSFGYEDAINSDIAKQERETAVLDDI